MNIEAELKQLRQGFERDRAELRQLRQDLERERGAIVALLSLVNLLWKRANMPGVKNQAELLQQIKDKALFTGSSDAAIQQMEAIFDNFLRRR